MKKEIKVPLLLRIPLFPFAVVTGVLLAIVFLVGFLLAFLFGKVTVDNNGLKVK